MSIVCSFDRLSPNGGMTAGRTPRRADTFGPHLLRQGGAAVGQAAASRPADRAIASALPASAVTTEVRPFADDSARGPAYAVAESYIPWSAMVLNSESKYPNRRAYVLKLRADATPQAFAGRLENLVTGRQHEFASAEELLASIASDLASADADGQ
jgi:hypothetical protein